MEAILPTGGADVGIGAEALGFLGGGSILGDVATGTLLGGGIGGLEGALTGGNVLQDALKGGVGGAFTGGGIGLGGEFLGPALGSIGGEALCGAAGGALGGLATGGNVGMGALEGGIGGAVSGSGILSGTTGAPPGTPGAGAGAGAAGVGAAGTRCPSGDNLSLAGDAANSFAISTGQHQQHFWYWHPAWRCYKWAFERSGWWARDIAGYVVSGPNTTDATPGKLRDT